MNEQPDPVDRALKLLKAQSWAHDAHDAKLEENLMQMVSTKPKTFGSAKRNVLVGALALLLIAGVGFAATGGIETVKSWFSVTIFIDGPDGQMEISGDAIDNGDGTYTVIGSDGTVVSFEVAVTENPDGVSTDATKNKDESLDFTAREGESKKWVERGTSDTSLRFTAREGESTGASRTADDNE